MTAGWLGQESDLYSDSPRLGATQATWHSSIDARTETAVPFKVIPVHTGFCVPNTLVEKLYVLFPSGHMVAGQVCVLAIGFGTRAPI